VRRVAHHATGDMAGDGPGDVAGTAAAVGAASPGPPTPAPFASLSSFVHGVAFGALPGDVVAQAARCLLDLVGVAAAGTPSRAAVIARDHVAEESGAATHGARILLDGRRVGRAGAAFAGATAIDAVDAHDGHPLTKGHAGVAVLPALLAFVDGDRPVGMRVDGRELLTAVVVGYEVATRAGIALHRSTPDYHCSGAWNALAAAAIGARLLGLGEEATRHALGIAEYHGPRGQILRVCAAPTMLKDGSSSGAAAGVTAALRAARGFTGAPAVTVEGPALAAWWTDLGTRWRIRVQYFKPYPVCRWAQPAIEGARELARAHAFGADDVARIDIESFAEAVALGAQCPVPATSDEAQYSIAWPVAAVLAFGDVGPEALAAVRDPRVARLLGLVRLAEDPALSSRFPAERHARVSVTLRDGRRLMSGDCVARGSAENPLTDAELRGKYDAYAAPVLGPARAARIAAAVAALADGGPIDALLDDLLAPLS
jgi:2-methylcitrate dehydratase PrpD